MSELLIDVVCIAQRREAVIGDIYRYRHVDIRPGVVTPGGDMAMYIDQETTEINSNIERVCFRSESGRVTEKFMTIHPRDKEEIAMLIDMSEANRLKKAKQNLEVWLDTERKEFNNIISQPWLTRLKWVFTGVKL